MKSNSFKQFLKVISINKEKKWLQYWSLRHPTKYCFHVRNNGTKWYHMCSVTQIWAKLVLNNTSDNIQAFWPEFCGQQHQMLCWSLGIFCKSNMIFNSFLHLSPVVQSMGNVIQQTNHYSADNCQENILQYPPGSNLSIG